MKWGKSLLDFYQRSGLEADGFDGKSYRRKASSGLKALHSLKNCMPPARFQAGALNKDSCVEKCDPSHQIWDQVPFSQT